MTRIKPSNEQIRGHLRKRWRSKSVREERAEDDISRCVDLDLEHRIEDDNLCVINMMFALLYDNNLDDGDAETHQNIIDSRSLPPLSHGYQLR